MKDININEIPDFVKDGIIRNWLKSEDNRKLLEGLI